MIISACLINLQYGDDQYFALNNIQSYISIVDDDQHSQSERLIRQHNTDSTIEFCDFLKSLLDYSLTVDQELRQIHFDHAVACAKSCLEKNIKPKFIYQSLFQLFSADLQNADKRIQEITDLMIQRPNFLQEVCLEIYQNLQYWDQLPELRNANPIFEQVLYHAFESFHIRLLLNPYIKLQRIPNEVLNPLNESVFNIMKYLYTSPIKTHFTDKADKVFSIRYYAYCVLKGINQPPDPSKALEI